MKYSDLSDVWGPLDGLSNSDKAKVFVERAGLILASAKQTGVFKTSTPGKLCPQWLKQKIGCGRSAITQNLLIRAKVEAFERLLPEITSAAPERTAHCAELTDDASLSLASRRRLRGGKIYFVTFNADEKRRANSQEILPYSVAILVFDDGIDEEASAWFRYRVVNDDVSPDTAKQEAKSLRRFVKFRRTHGVPWNRTDDALLRRYRATLRSRKLKTKTINSEISVAFRFYVWAEQKGHLENWVETGPQANRPLHLKDHKFAITGKLVRQRSATGATYSSWVSTFHKRDKDTNAAPRRNPIETEVRDMHRAAMRRKFGKRDSIILSWAEETGARSMDIAALELSHIPSEDVIEEIRAGRRTWTIKLIMKGQKSGILRPSADLLQRTRNYIDTTRADTTRRFPLIISNCVFLSNKNGGGLTKGAVGKIGKQAALDANIFDISIHRLRGLFSENSLRVFAQAYEEEFKGIGPGGNVTTSLLTLIAEVMNHLTPHTLRPYIGPNFEAKLRNTEAYKNFEIRQEIEARRRELEVLVDVISRHEMFAKIVQMEANGDKAGTIELVRAMLVQLTAGINPSGG